MQKEALRVSTMVPAAGSTLYFAWLNAKQHSEMTAAQVKLEPEVGGDFFAKPGGVTGKLISLELGRRIVMSWRNQDFPSGAPDSRLEVHLEPTGATTRVTLLHSDIPQGLSDKIRAYWNDVYFAAMRNHFSKLLPDPRVEPPPRTSAALSRAAISEPSSKPKLPGKPDRPAKAAPAPAPAPKAGPRATLVGKPAAKAAPPAKPAPPKPTKAAKPTAKPAPKPAKKAAAKPVKKPAKPAPKPAKKATAKPAPKPAKKPAKPAPKPAKKPAPKPAKKPAPKPAKKPKR